MKNRTIRIISLLAFVSITGIVVLQVKWFREAYDVKEQEFDQNVFTALQNVGEQILTINNQQIPNSGLVDQLSGNYFVVSVNGEIDTRMLESLLRAEFSNRNLLMDFEYGVYDCNHQKLVYGNYVSFAKADVEHTAKELPQWKNDLYYFSVFFPDKTSHLVGRLEIWLYLSAILLLVTGFFAFALAAIFRQKQLSEVQKDFVNNMTHEFKTPVSTILVTSRLLDKPEVSASPELIRQYSSLIRLEAERLRSQVERVLQVAVWDEKQLKYRPERIKVNECLRHAIGSVEQLAAEKGGTIICETDPDDPEVVFDKMHLSNVFFNLLDNSIKYNRGQPEVKATVKQMNGEVVITFTDNGIGIPEKSLRRIFDRFYRVHTGDVHDVKGFGLGLYYVKKVIREGGGSIAASSRPGVGTTFTIKLDLAS